jgi:hypothetical protein
MLALTRNKIHIMKETRSKKIHLHLRFLQQTRSMQTTQENFDHYLWFRDKFDYRNLSVYRFNELLVKRTSCNIHTLPIENEMNRDADSYSGDGRVSIPDMLMTDRQKRETIDGVRSGKRGWWNVNPREKGRIRGLFKPINKWKFYF